MEEVSYPMAKLSRVRKVLQSKFRNLQVFEGETHDMVPFLHIWRPVLQYSAQGLQFLPCFHIILRLSEEMNGDDETLEEMVEVSNPTTVQLELYSFHGKLLDKSALLLSEILSEEVEKIELLRDLESGQLHICQGIQDVKAGMLESFLRGSKLSLLEKVRSIFLIEQFEEEIVFRSRLCKFAVYNSIPNQNPKAKDFVRCAECEIFNEKRSVSFFTYLRRWKNNEIDSSRVSHVVDITKNKLNNGDDCRMFSRVQERTLKEEAEFQRTFNRFKVLSTLGFLSDRCQELDKSGDDSLETVDVPGKQQILVPTSGEVLVSKSSSKCSIAGDDADCSRQHCDEEADDDGNLVSIPSSKWNELKEQWKVQKVDLKNSISKPNGKKRILKSGGLSGPLHIPAIELPDISIKEEVDELSNDSQHSDMEGCNGGVVEVSFSDEESNHIGAAKINVAPKPRNRKKMKLSKDDASRQRLPCFICLQVYHAPSLVKKCIDRHEEELDLDPPCKCPLCSQEISSKRLLPEHFQTCHSEGGKACCCECFVVMPVGDNRLRRHFLKKHHPASRGYLCNTCGKTCGTEGLLRIHIADHESNVKVCDQCGKTFTQRRALVEHLARHRERRNLKCPRCDKSFKSIGQANKHSSMHSGFRPYKCCQCSYSSYYHTNVSAHFKGTHGSSPVQSSVVRNDDEYEEMKKIMKRDVALMIQHRNAMKQ